MKPSETKFRNTLERLIRKHGQVLIQVLIKVRNKNIQFLRWRKINKNGTFEWSNIEMEYFTAHMSCWGTYSCFVAPRGTRSVGLKKGIRNMQDYDACELRFPNCRVLLGDIYVKDEAGEFTKEIKFE